MKAAMVLFVILVSGWSLSAQEQLNGLWEGVLTRGNLEARDGYRFELYLKVEGARITGRSYLYLEKGKIVEMELSGYIYEDRSVYLKEEEWIPREGITMDPPFLRKFQLLYSRSIWENKLEGYWQELVPQGEVLKTKEYGRIFLKRFTPDKA
ncbi:MAG: hypothetical protein NWR67_14935 [Saprospiraceae bacterium]|nr:hypothetical protein [Saprospiraceae bacterium]MDP4822303.1 hypothetical protein [Saprospiraceae bacterium]MDP4999613.1 hypothetical protein [Saprospiraceae bacterium]